MKEKDFLKMLEEAKEYANEHGWEKGWIDAANGTKASPDDYIVEIPNELTQEQEETYIKEVKAEYSESYETSYHLEIKEKEEGVQAY